MVAFGRFGKQTLDEAPGHFQKKFDAVHEAKISKKVLPGEGLFSYCCMLRFAPYSLMEWRQKSLVGIQCLVPDAAERLTSTKDDAFQTGYPYRI